MENQDVAVNKPYIFAPLQMNKINESVYIKRIISNVVRHYLPEVDHGDTK